MWSRPIDTTSNNTLVSLCNGVLTILDINQFERLQLNYIRLTLISGDLPFISIDIINLDIFFDEFINRFITYIYLCRWSVMSTEKTTDNKFTYYLKNKRKSICINQKHLLFISFRIQKLFGFLALIVSKYKILHLATKTSRLYYALFFSISVSFSGFHFFLQLCWSMLYKYGPLTQLIANEAVGLYKAACSKRSGWISI